MKEFLKKFLSEEQLKSVEDAYMKANPDAKGLPVYISKNRLDEVLGQKKDAESKLAALQGEFDQFKEQTDTLTKKAVDDAINSTKKENEKTILSMKADFNATEAIYKAHGRNVKAIKALIDPKAKLEDEITRLQKSDPYLFGDDIPDGTGKSGSGSHDDANAELAAMRRAVGIK